MKTITGHVYWNRVPACGATNPVGTAAVVVVPFAQAVAGLLCPACIAWIQERLGDGTWEEQRARGAALTRRLQAEGQQVGERVRLTAEAKARCN